MSVFASVQQEIEQLGPEAEASVEAQTALALAAALDDRAGVQAGGLASTAKQLLAVMAELRTMFKRGTKSKLELLRGA